MRCIFRECCFPKFTSVSMTAIHHTLMSSSIFLHKKGTFLLNCSESLILISMVENWQVWPPSSGDVEILSQIKTRSRRQIGGRGSGRRQMLLFSRSWEKWTYRTSPYISNSDRLGASTGQLRLEEGFTGCIT